MLCLLLPCVVFVTTNDSDSNSDININVPIFQEKSDSDLKSTVSTIIVIIYYIKNSNYVLKSAPTDTNTNVNINIDINSNDETENLLSELQETFTQLFYFLEHNMITENEAYKIFINTPLLESLFSKNDRDDMEREFNDKVIAKIYKIIYCNIITLVFYFKEKESNDCDDRNGNSSDDDDDVGNMCEDIVVLLFPSTATKVIMTILTISNVLLLILTFNF